MKKFIKLFVVLLLALTMPVMVACGNGNQNKKPKEYSLNFIVESPECVLEGPAKNVYEGIENLYSFSYDGEEILYIDSDGLDLSTKIEEGKLVNLIIYVPIYTEDMTIQLNEDTPKSYLTEEIVSVDDNFGKIEYSFSLTCDSTIHINGKFQ